MMQLVIHHDKTLVVELLSAMAFLVMSISLVVFRNIAPDLNNSPFWISFFFIFSVLQFMGLAFKFDLVLLRVCMAWVAGSTWTWLALVSINNILAIPVMGIGLFNLYAFIVITNRTTIDWKRFFQE